MWSIDCILSKYKFINGESLLPADPKFCVKKIGPLDYIFNNYVIFFNL